jgi:NAD(P)-dependent dehydrogenase (short-subunit alcohol dehydrogenase family)
MRSFVDKVVVVTGAGSGMGRAYALAFAQLGAKLALNDFNASALMVTVQLLQQRGLGPTRLYAEAFDVSHRPSMVDFAAHVQSQLGPAHVLINNAGISGKAQHVEQVPLEDFQRLMQINVEGVWNGTQAFLPQLRAQEEAVLVNVSSVLGLIGMPGNAAYCASKFAVRGMTEALMVELQGSPIQVHLVHPGGVNTGIADDSPKGRAFAAKFLKTEPEEVVQMVIKGIRCRRARMVYGHQAVFSWWLSWAIPLHWRTRLLQRQAKAVMRERVAPHGDT